MEDEVGLPGDELIVEEIRRESSVQPQTVIPVEGELEIEVFRKLRGRDVSEDRVLVEKMGANLVVNDAKKILSKVMGHDVTYDLVKMKFGMGGCPGGVVRIPEVTDVDLVEPLGTGVIPGGWKDVVVTFSGTTTIYTAILDYDEGNDYDEENGTPISEECICANITEYPGVLGLMFAVKCFQTKDKTNEWKFVFSHKLRF